MGIGAVASTTCPRCGKQSLYITSCTGYTARALPFNSEPRIEQVTESKYRNLQNVSRRGIDRYYEPNRANGRSTGRPKKVRSLIVVAAPKDVRLPGDRV